MCLVLPAPPPPFLPLPLHPEISYTLIFSLIIDVCFTISFISRLSLLCDKRINMIVICFFCNITQPVTTETTHSQRRVVKRNSRTIFFWIIIQLSFVFLYIYFCLSICLSLSLSLSSGFFFPTFYFSSQMFDLCSLISLSSSPFLLPPTHSPAISYDSLFSVPFSVLFGQWSVTLKQLFH